MCVALAALDATVIVKKPVLGERAFTLRRIHRLPGSAPGKLDNTSGRLASW